MKKILIAASTLLIFSCTSSDKKTMEDSQHNNEVGVQNPNGIIPDTTNAINLSTHKKDTVPSKDSLQR